MMSDGVRLAADLCLPSGRGPFPSVVIRTPYDRRLHRAELRAWASHGFAAMAQDVRGRHASDGQWRPYQHEEGDGAATVRWLRGQRWSDGHVVASGSSYAAYCALSAALGASSEERPDAVIAAVPALGLAETAREPGRPGETGEPGGPERLFARTGWWAAHGDRRDSDETALDDALARDPRLFEHLPLAGLPHRLGRDLPSWPHLWRAQRRSDVALRGASADVPLLAVGGSRDPFRDDTVELWQHWGGPARLLIGPWGHALTASPGPEAHPKHRLNLGALYVRWARAALAGQLSGGRRGVAALGGSQWWTAMADDVEETEYPFGTCTGLRLVRGEQFTADPEQPVRSDALTVPATGEPDRCLLVTAPIPRPLDLLGPARVRLTAAADTPCADWVVRLVALDPRGTADPVALGVVRRKDGGNDPARIEVPLGHVARRLPAGTRLRLEVAGHHFPAHARNPHTGEDPLTATRLLPSRRSLILAGSALSLPVVPARHRVPRVDPAQEICS
ncbi:CocE/NonD family hydrolase [Streptomyces sp. ISL-98]|uniref:CocE/NonD family hydrolase n=1 Tax=Streptomyces sp. ISL-98 TaxID=2819192 RepID=UPI001BE7AB8A|nr:CocE/NonD family hydrolase [Streptomyces sp. ISL-98]MBT2510367.1 CocE/NonD family hydrolase [Streptomyces sp. ISL-98]